MAPTTDTDRHGDAEDRQGDDRADHGEPREDERVAELVHGVPSGRTPQHVEVGDQAVGLPGIDPRRKPFPPPLHISRTTDAQPHRGAWLEELLGQCAQRSCRREQGAHEEADPGAERASQHGRPDHGRAGTGCGRSATLRRRAGTAGLERTIIPHTAAATITATAVSTN